MRLPTRYDVDSLHNRDPALIDRIYRRLRPVLWRVFRPEVRGLQHVPPGAALYVGNHNAAMLMPDAFLFGAALYERHGMDAMPYGLAHELGVQLPGVHELLVRLGAVRGCEENALRIFAAGHKVWVYPGGELDSMRAWRDRERVVFDGRRGYVRLALRAGVPVVPFVAAGAHETLRILDDGRWLARWLRIDRWLGVKTWPIVLCLPWGLWIGVPPPHLPWPSRILIEVLPPIRFERSGEEAARDADYVEACHRRVHGAMQAALTRLSAERRRGGRR